MPRTNARGRGQFFEAESEDKILGSRPACPRGLTITVLNAADWSNLTAEQWAAWTVCLSMLDNVKQHNKYGSI